MELMLNGIVTHSCNVNVTMSGTYFFAEILSVFWEKIEANNFLQKLWKEEDISKMLSSEHKEVEYWYIYLFVFKHGTSQSRVSTYEFCPATQNWIEITVENHIIHLVIKNSSATGKMLPKPARNPMQYGISCTSSSNPMFLVKKRWDKSFLMFLNSYSTIWVEVVEGRAKAVKIWEE